MSAGVLLLVGLVGGAGACARFLVDAAVTRRTGGRLPAGIFVVNVSGAFLLGVLFGAEAGGDAWRVFATGLLGAFTTFSTWMLESHLLVAAGRPRAGAANLVVSLVAGLLAVWLGRHVGGLL